MKREELIDLGRELERNEHSQFFHLFLGWACLFFGFAWFLFSIWSFKERLIGLIVLVSFGISSLYLGYSERKELRSYKGNRK